MRFPLAPPLARTRGSSLVETLVALALGMLALVLCTNSVLAVVVGESRTNAARALAASLAFARAEAALRRAPVAVCGLDARDATLPTAQVRCAPAGAAWHAGWIVFGDNDLDGRLDDGETVLQVSRIAGLTVQPASEPIVFRPIGTLAQATAQRLLVGPASEERTQAVCVAIDGHARVQAPQATCQ
jgi:type IV fimbrial biogenesis protein FimT